MGTPSRIPVVEVVVTHDLDLRALSRLSRMLDDAMSLRPSQLVIDLAQCSFMDAAAIGVLLEAHRRTHRNGGQLTLRSPSDRLRRNLRLARVDRVLHVEPDDANAGAGQSSPSGLETDCESGDTDARS